MKDFRISKAFRILTALWRLVVISSSSKKPSLIKMLYLLKYSKSQLSQDLFVLAQTNFSKEGFFVEFGATNGLDLSNSWLLEKQLGWTGILAEPASFWHESLERNRPLAKIEKKCVWKDSHSTLLFNETLLAELSTVDTYSDLDSHSKSREMGSKYLVDTITLRDLLIKHNAPKYIDFLSIDTEGSELEILSAFDFSEYRFGVITCEHNYTEKREEIYNLLTSNGYKRIMTSISRFDDWYIQV